MATLMPGEVVAIDGKTVRRSHDKCGQAGHPLGQRLGLGQYPDLGAGEDARNQAIPRLLEMLELSGCIVTIDAMGCQKEIARTIVDRGADYLARRMGQL